VLVDWRKISPITEIGRSVVVASGIGVECSTAVSTKGRAGVNVLRWNTVAVCDADAIGTVEQAAQNSHKNKENSFDFISSLR
jgi:hypothetical protein